jgi:hypothetical protein
MSLFIEQTDNRGSFRDFSLSPVIVCYFTRPGFDVPSYRPGKTKKSIILFPSLATAKEEDGMPRHHSQLDLGIDRAVNHVTVKPCSPFSSVLLVSDLPSHK